MSKYKNQLKWFVGVMDKKLSENIEKEPWDKLSIRTLLCLLDGERGELREAINSGTNNDIILECADVANFAMMIADIYRKAEP